MMVRSNVTRRPITVQLLSAASLVLTVGCSSAPTRPVGPPPPEWLPVGDQWQPFTFAASGDEWFVAPATFTSPGPALIRVWTLVGHAQSMWFFGNWFDSAQMLFEFDCKERRHRILQMSRFKGTQVTSTAREATSWSFGAPGSVGNSLLEHACGRNE